MHDLVLQMLCGALVAWVGGLVIRSRRGWRNLAAGVAGALVARIGYAIVLGNVFGLFGAPFDLETLAVIGAGGLAGLVVDCLLGALIGGSIKGSRQH